VDAGAVEADKIKRIPFAKGFPGVRQLHAAIANRRLLHEQGWRALGVVKPQFPFRAGRHGDLRTQREKIAHVMLLNLELDRSRPRLVIKPRFAMTEVEQPAIARGMQLGTPLFPAPFDLETEMEISERLDRRDHAETLARDMDRRAAVDIFDHKDLQWVAILADRFEVVALFVALQAGHVPSPVRLGHEHFPAGEIPAIEKRSPRLRRVLGGGARQTKQYVT
jgi:hypothetical protein